jgi:hypothetical protein
MSYQSEPLQTTEPVIVQVKEYEGTLRLDIRHWYYDANHQLKPGFKGVNILAEFASKLLDNVKDVQVGVDAKIGLDCGKSHIMVRNNVFKGNQYLDIRHVFPQANGRIGFTEKGVSIPWNRSADFVRILEVAVLEHIAPVHRQVRAMVEVSVQPKREWDAFEIGRDVKVTDSRFSNIEL